ncbi:zinc finger protein 40 isoform X2 [Periplaneta americana]|uniref:zinc finger protein 40 isoform X2 n=1 Tax=Periplaneta americana TaxID=6978 RepID=UPI0037E8D30B
MPRRKGQGISPTKRATQSKDEHQSKKKAADNNEDPGGGSSGGGYSGVGGGDGVQTDDGYSSSNTSKSTDTTSSSCDLNNSKYLHKKFKKMATASLPSEALAAPPLEVTAEETLVNGIAFGSVTTVESNTTGSKVSDASSKAMKIASVTEGLKNKVGIESASSPVATSRGASPSVMTSSPVPPAPLPPPVSSSSSSLSSSSSSSLSSVPQQGRYVCPYCKLACAKPSVLQKHIRAHTNERPYPCQPCGFAFKTKSNLYKHCRSRAHALKMEEEGSNSGTKFNLPSAESSDVEDDEDENYSNSTPPPTSLAPTTTITTVHGNNCSVSSNYTTSSTTLTTTATSTTTSAMSSLPVTNEANNNQDKPRQIYKPKFHKAALYQEEGQQLAADTAVTAKSKLTVNPTTSAQSLDLYLKTSLPSSQMNPTSSLISTSKNPSSPSPEYLQRHISKIISDNQAIVETVDPHWSKKFLQRQTSKEQLREGSPASPLSPLSSPGIDVTSQWPKKLLQRQMSLNDPGGFETERAKLSGQQSAHSKLALALLGSNRHESASLSPRPSESPLSVVSTTPEPSLSYQQPLNLSTSHHASNKMSIEEPSSNHPRKRCHSDSFAISGPGRSHFLSATTVLKDHNILTTTNNATNYHRGQTNSKLARLDGTGTTVAFIEGLSPGSKNHTNEKLLYHPQNPEGSIIKDLLLKARAAVSAGIPPSAGIYPTSMTEIVTLDSLPSGNISYLSGEEDIYICPLCKIPFRNAQNLEIHQRHYCKGEISSKPMSISSPQHSPNTTMKYGPISSHALELHPQMAANAEDIMGVAGHTVKTASMQGLHTLNIPKGPSKVGKQEYKPSPLTPPSRESGKTPTLVVPPFPSPGPLLGNTPLVDSYHQLSLQQQKKREDTDNEEILEEVHRRGPVLKKRRLDSELSRDTSSTTSSPDIRPLSTTPLSGIMSPSTTTLRSLEELSKCPMRPNSLQMFGGEVQILDGAGETKTMRIEPSSRGGKSPGAPGGAADLILSLPNHLHPGGVLISSGNSKGGASESEGEGVPGNVSPHIVVTIARSGLHSGGTIVQVPQKSSTPSGTVASGLVKPPRTSGGSINPMNAPSPKNVTSPLPKQQQKNISGGGMILNSASPSTSPYCTATLLTSNTNTITNTFPDTSKLLVPIVPNIATPNLAVPGIPAPNLSHHLPFIPFHSYLSDGTLLNPLTSITAYNPLTLPPHSSILHQSPHVLQTLSMPQPQTKDKKSPGTVSSSPIPRDNNVPPPPYSGGVVTILHGGKAIPYVPGMPGPHSLLPTVPSPVGIRKEPSPKPLDLASPSREPQHSFKIADHSKTPQQSAPLVPKSLKSSGAISTISNITAIGSVTAVPSSHYQKDDLSRMVNSKASTNTLLKIPKTPHLIPSIKVDTPIPVSDHNTDNTASIVEDATQHTPNVVHHSVRKISKGSRPDMLAVQVPKEILNEKDDKLNKESEEGRAKKTEKTNENEEPKTKGNNNGNRPKFLRPTTLPLKPGTFIPKKHHGTGLTPTGTVLSLISPETPRPRKSYGQLYLNGHAYTYLGLKCSTRTFYCTLNRPQPMYVPQSPEHAKLSMYSNWKICLEADPNPFGLDPGQAMAFYDSRHRPTTYTVAKPTEHKPMILTHSSYWLEKSQSQQCEKLKTAEKKNDANAVAEKSHTDTGKDTGTKTEGSENPVVTGRGRYVCEECGIRCKKPSMLKKHIRTHTDVRPFTCKHCNFSFKTKGNLTKHMKSKAHYKKCMELGIVPVPTVVDDSYIDEECLARQQALRASRHGEGETDSDENEEEEEDEEDEEEDEEEEQNPADGDETNVNKGKLEREAACSLLSLSESTRVNTSSSQYISAGLIPLSSHCGRPTTYPYSLTLPIPGPNCHGSSFNTPQTPTLTAVSAQTEREKVSKNTGLALELRSNGEGKLKDEEGRVSSTIRRRGNAAALVLIPPQQGDANRYYFPSCRTPTIPTNLPMASFTRNSAADKCSLDGGSDSDYDRENSSTAYSDDEDSERSDNSVRDKKPQERNSNEIISCEVHATSSMQPMDLSNKTQTTTVVRKTSTTLLPYLPPLTTNGARTPTTPISEILTPVSEPATLLASLCSSVERFPVSTTMLVQKAPDPAETTMLQAYLTERALQDVRIKQHQFHHNHHGYVTVTTTAASTTSTSVSMTMQEMAVVTRSLSVQKPSVDNENISKEDPHVSLKISQATIDSPSSSHGQVLNMRIKDVELSSGLEKPSVQEPPESSSKSQPQSSECENEKSIVASEKSKLKESTVLKIQTSSSGENITSTKMNLVPMSSNNIVRNVVVGGIGFSGHQPSSPPSSTSGTGINKSSSPTKPKAEFLPPSSGPSPSYVSMTEDGRSICVICNKIFSKPSQLRLHVNIHYFERPFRCESCAVSFRTKGHLQKHERSVSHQNKVSMNSTFGTPTTTNPRPFKCDDCKIAFRIHGHLAKHLRSKMHIMKLECVGKLPFGTYAEMEREGISLNEIDTTDCDNSLESLQVLAQKLYEKDPSKLGQWDGERGEILPSHPLPQMSGGETSSDEGEPLLGCQSPPGVIHNSATGVQENVAGTSIPELGPNQDALLLRSSTTDAGFSKQNYEYEKKEDIGTHGGDSDCRSDMLQRKEDIVNQNTTKFFISTENTESPVHGNREFITSKRYTANYQLDSGDTKSLEWNNGMNKMQQGITSPPKRQLNTDYQNEPHKSESVVGTSEAQLVRTQSSQLKSHQMPRQRGSSVSKERGSMRISQSEEVDYEDASDGDNDGGPNSMFSCSICRQTFPNLGALQVHSFVEHDSSMDMTEDAPCSTSTSTTTSDNIVLLTSKVPTLHNQKLNMPLLVSSGEVSKGSTVSYLSQYRKRPSMTDNGKEISDGNILELFSKRPNLDNQDFKVSSATIMPIGENYDSMSVEELSATRQQKLNIQSSSQKEKRVVESVAMVCGGDSGTRLMDTYEATSEKGLGRMESATKINQSNEKIEVEDSKSGKDSGIDLKQRTIEKLVGEDMQNLRVSVEQVTDACVTKSESIIQCRRLEANANRTDIKVQSSDEYRQHNIDESAKSDQTLARQFCERVNTCESVDSRQLPINEQHKGDNNAPDGQQTKLNCDLCGKVQSSRESLKKHLLSHAQLRPFVCEFCDAGFISHQSLQSHLMMHQQKDKSTTSQ